MSDLDEEKTVIQKFIVHRDDSIYEAFPDVALTETGRLVCVFAECTHHHDRTYTRIIAVHSDGRGRTWSPKQGVTGPRHNRQDGDPYWNCARISALSDGRLVVVVDEISGPNEGSRSERKQNNLLFFSDDNGETWSEALATPVHGIVPDQVVELREGPHTGRLLLSTHTIIDNLWMQRVWLSDDKFGSWSGPYTVASVPSLKLCEGSIFTLPGDILCCLLRENSCEGLDAFKTISRDGGVTWSDVTAVAIPACHRPVGGMLQSGRVLVTHRYLQGGANKHGWMTQNFFAALTDVESCLATERCKTSARIMPLDFDRSPVADTGYSGWVQFDDGEIYVVNYIIDDAPKAHIRGYSFFENDIILEKSEACQ